MYFNKDWTSLENCGLFNEASLDDLMLLDAMATSGVNKLARETGLGLEVEKSMSWLLLNMKKSTCRPSWR